MFPQNGDLDEEDLDGEDAVVPISMVVNHPPPQLLGTANRSASCDAASSEGSSTRSAQYQERLNRARQQKMSSAQRRSVNNGARSGGAQAGR